MTSSTEPAKATRTAGGILKSCSLLWLPPVIAAILFCIASACFVESIKGLVSLAQPLMGFLIAFVITGTFCWEWKVFGNPKKISRLAVHLLFGASLFFMINALFAENPEKDNLLGIVVSSARWLSGWIVKSPFISSLFDVISSPGVAVLFLVTCLAFSIPRRDIAVGTFAVAAVLVIVFGMMGDAMANRGWFLAGMLALGLGCWVLFENRDRTIFWDNVRTRLGNDPSLRGDVELKVRLLERFLITQTPESSRDCLGLVARTLSLDSETPEAKQAMLRVVRQMIEQDKVAVLTYPKGVAALAPHPDLTNSEQADMWSAVGRSVKVLVVGVIALIWIVSPIDLVPDQIPIAGVIDDVIVALLGFGAVRQGLGSRKSDQGDLASLD